MKKAAMNIVLGIGVLYIGVCGFLYIYQRNLMYFPGGPRPALTAETPPEFLITHPETGLQLEGLYWPAKADRPTIVFFHGNGQAYQYWVDKLASYRQKGYGVLFTDYRGYGGQPGKPTEQGIYADARSFITALEEQKNIKPQNMIFYGESLGTGVAVQMATETAPMAVILENAYSATSDVAKGRYKIFPVELLMKDQYRSIDKIGALSMPKLLVHGQKDQVIPIRYGRRLYEAAAEPKEFKVIANAGHNNVYDHGAGLHILSFLSSISAKSP